MNNVKYYFNRNEIVEVLYDHSYDRTDMIEGFIVIAYVYKNIHTEQTYYIEKQYRDSEIFDNKEELIEFKIKEFEDKISLYKDKILCLNRLRIMGKYNK